MRFVTTILVGDPTFVTNISDLFIADSDAGKVLVSATYLGAGLASFSISDAELPATHVSQWEYPWVFGHLGDPGIELIQQDDRVAVTLVGVAGGSRFLVPIELDGSLGTLEYLYQDTALPRDVLTLGRFQMGGMSYVYVVQRGDVEFTLYRELATGGLAEVDRSFMPLAPTMPDASLDQMLVVTVGAQTILISASGLGNFLASQRLDAEGNILRGDYLKIGRGTGFNVPNDIEAVTVAGNVYLILTSAASSSITTVRVLSNGSMIPVDHVIDELTTRFQRATALATVEADGRAYVFVGGADGGISMFTVLPDGKLLHLNTLVDDDLMTLGNVSAIAAQKVGNQIVLFVASARETGITQLVVDLGQAGRTIKVGAGRIEGTDRDDMLQAGRSTTEIKGGNGDDVLITSRDPIALWGGAGRDTFIPTPIVGRILIWDFDPNEDQLDLTQLGMIRSVLQLKLVPFGKGIRVWFGETLVEIHSSYGGSISADYFSNLLFAITHYVPPDVATVIVGSRQDDLLRATRGGSELYGVDGNDMLLGSAVEDFVNGGTGHDTLLGGRGNDTMDGGEGDDRVRGGFGDDILSGRDGHDMLIGDQGNDRLHGHGGNDTLFGGVGDDVLIGAEGDDYLSGDDGDDVLQGDDGNDSLNGGNGHDRLVDMAGNNLLAGGAGNDTLIAGAGADGLYGGDGDDHMTAGEGDDTIDGSLGDDTIFAGAGNDRIFGGHGNDLVNGDDGDDRIIGDLGQDTLDGGAGSDVVLGGHGDDSILGGAGADSLFGGSGHDQIDAGDDADTIFGGTGNDTFWGGNGDDMLVGGVGNNVLMGGGGRDLIQGDGQDDWLQGDEGDDTLFGHHGNDSLDGGGGNDLLFAGAGHDLVIGGAGRDLLLGGEGDDTLQGGDHEDQLQGDVGNDRLEGGAGLDILQGGEGNDTLIGGASMDMLFGDAGADHFVFQSASDSGPFNSDRIFDFEQGADKIDLVALGLQFIGTQGFSAAGQLRLVTNSDHSLLLADIDGNGQAEFGIRIEGPITITQDDLLL